MCAISPARFQPLVAARSAAHRPGPGFRRDRCPVGVAVLALSTLVGGPARASTDLPAAATATTESQPLPRIRVRAPRLPAAAAELDETAASAVIEGRDLRQRHRDTAEALEAQPGLDVQRLGGNGAPAWLRIRGSTSDQVSFFIADLPASPLDGSALPLDDLPASQVERLEVYRGATPGSLDGQAIGGAVRAVLRRPEETPAGLQVSAGSPGALEADGVLAWSLGQAAGSLGLRWGVAAGDWMYLHDNGTLFDRTDDRWRPRSNNDSQRLAWLLVQDAAAGAWRGQALWLGALSWQGLPGRALYEASAARYDSSRHRLLVAAEHRGRTGRGRLKLLARVETSAGEVDDRQGELGLPLASTTRLTTFGGRALWQSPLGRLLALQARLDASRGLVTGRDLLAGVDLPCSTRTSLGVGLDLPLRLGEPALTILPSLAAEVGWDERQSAVVAPFVWKRESLPARVLPTARLGAAWQLRPSWSLRTGWTAARRTPTLAELFGNDGTIVGNPGLRPERGQTLDAGLAGRWAGGRWRLGGEIGGFVQQVDELIGLRMVAPHRARWGNVAGARLAGLEARARAGLGETLAADALWHLLDSENRSGEAGHAGRVLPMRPRSRWQIRTEAGARPFPAAGRLSAWASVGWQAGHFLDEANLVALPAQTSAAAGAAIESPRGEWRLALRLDNLTGTQSSDLLGYPLPGRSLQALVSWLPGGRP